MTTSDKNHDDDLSPFTQWGPINRTPAGMRCAIAASCASVHELEGDRLLIVGRRATPEDLSGPVDYNIGDEEEAIVIDRALLSDVFLVQTPSPPVESLSGHLVSDFSAKAREVVALCCGRFDKTSEDYVATVLREASELGAAAERREVRTFLGCGARAALQDGDRTEADIPTDPHHGGKVWDRTEAVSLPKAVTPETDH